MYDLSNNLRGRSIHSKVIPTVCNLKNMLNKLVEVQGRCFYYLESFHNKIYLNSKNIFELMLKLSKCKRLGVIHFI